MRVIAFGFCPVINMMYVKLRDLIFALATQYARVVVTFLYELANSFPSPASITIPSALPVRRFVASHSISRVVFARSCSKYAHSALINFWWWILFWMATSIFSIASGVAKQSVFVGELTTMFGAAIRAYNGYSISALSEFTSAFDRASFGLIGILVELIIVPLINGTLFSTTFAGVRYSWHLTSLIGLDCFLLGARQSRRRACRRVIISP
jgi:hypothetical protein